MHQITLTEILTELIARDFTYAVYHPADPAGMDAKIIDVLQKLVYAGNTVIVIEHNLDLIKTADHVIDLGPEGGDGGGYVVASGTPEEVAAVPESYTGQYLKKYL